jgi:hypothetical protein
MYSPSTFFASLEIAVPNIVNIREIVWLLFQLLRYSYSKCGDFSETIDEITSRLKNWKDSCQHDHYKFIDTWCTKLFDIEKQYRKELTCRVNNESMPFKIIKKLFSEYSDLLN